MRIAVFGTGGAGGYFGSQLALAGEDVTFIARGEHLRAIQATGLRLETPLGEAVIRAKATDDPSKVGHVDAVLVGVKAWQVTQAAHSMKPLVGLSTAVVPLQNGVEAASELAAVLGPAVLGGLCSTLSYVAGPAHVRSIGGRNFIKFGELDNAVTDRVAQLKDCFAAANVSVEIPDNIMKALWEKFLMVTSIGGIGAVTRLPIGVTRSVPETRRLLEQCLQEVYSVATALSIPLADTAVSDTMSFYDSLPPNGTTSLQRDITDGKMSELEYWNGAVVRLGRKASVKTPVNEFVYGSLLPSELQARRRP